MKDRDFREEILTLFQEMVTEIKQIRGLLEGDQSPRKVSTPAVEPKKEKTVESKTEPKKEPESKPVAPRRTTRK